MKELSVDIFKFFCFGGFFVGFFWLLFCFLAFGGVFLLCSCANFDSAISVISAYWLFWPA